MPAPLKNDFWKRRAKFGRECEFTPEQLWEDACGYFEWVSENPLMSASPVTFQGKGSTFDIAKLRPMTINGLCLYLGISYQTWLNYCKREAFVEVTGAIIEITRTHQLEGAAAGLLNPNIIARLLGLADKTELTGANGGAIQTEELGGRDLARRVGFLLAKAVHDQEKVEANVEE